MLTSYLVIALRSLRRHPGTTAINVVGLAIGLACALLIFQYVTYERSFDAFHADADRIYRLTYTGARSGEDPETIADVAYAFGPELAADLPGVDGVVRLHSAIGTVVSDPERPERAFEETEVYWADPSFLSAFSFPLVRGDASRALAEPGTILLSEMAARKLFGAADPVGRALTVTAWRQTRTARVSGVFADVPATSHLQVEMLMPMADILANPMYAEDAAGWSWFNFITYVRLAPGADAGAVSAQMTQGLLRHEGDDLRAAGTVASLALQPLRDVHLDDGVVTRSAGAIVSGSRQSVRVLSLIGLITLLIALVNYVNLATARAANRSREVGVRKAIGAQRGQLVTQFLAESALVNAVAFALAVVLAVLFQPVVGRLAQADLSAVAWSPGFWAAAAGAFVGSTLLAGLYPAVVLSSFRPVAALRGGVSGGGHAGLRRGLVVVQFVATVVLVVGMLVMHSQLRYVRGLDLGLDLEQVVTVPAPSVRPDGTERAADTQAFKDRLATIAAVQQVATSHSVPGQGYAMGTSTVRREGADEASTVDGDMTEVDAGFTSLYGVEIVAGDAFPDRAPGPGEDLLLASETAVRSLGFASPEAAVGENVIVGGPSRRVVGVFRDVRWTSAHVARENAFLRLTDAGTQVSIRVRADALPQTLDAIEAAYTDLFPGNPFRYQFADAQYAQLYAADQRSASLFAVFAGLAVVIACLGLFGLAAFTTQQRTQEVGVRKVLGASVGGLLVLLSKDTLRLVGLAAVVAAPLAWWAMSRWLEAFADRIALGPLPFLAAAALVLAIALATVSLHTVRAATADPVRALRSE